MAKAIPRQKKVRELTPAEAALKKQIDDLKAKMKEERKKTTQAGAEKRKAQVSVSFMISRYVQTLVASKSETAIKMVNAAMNSLTPSENLSQEKIEELKKYGQLWLDGKL